MRLLAGLDYCGVDQARKMPFDIALLNSVIHVRVSFSFFIICCSSRVVMHNKGHFSRASVPPLGKVTQFLLYEVTG